MVIPNVKEQILTDLARMSPDMQRHAAELVHNLMPAGPKGAPGLNLARFAGILDSKSAREMSEAIAKGCERIDRDDW